MQYSLITIKVNESYNKAAYIYLCTLYTSFGIYTIMWKRTMWKRAQYQNAGPNNNPFRLRAGGISFALLERELYFLGGDGGCFGLNAVYYYIYMVNIVVHAWVRFMKIILANPIYSFQIDIARICTNASRHNPIRLSYWFIVCACICVLYNNIFRWVCYTRPLSK